jgi:hypothetical protein
MTSVPFQFAGKEILLSQLLADFTSETMADWDAQAADYWRKVSN